ncbi:MAG TPA: replication-relaxation family protein [bacterium]|nr:replication-relaxation family protein [bacterium]
MPKNPELTARDLTILWYTWQQRFMAVRQFQRLLWPQGANVTARNRLNELRDAGFLASETFPVGVDRTLYYSTKAGNRALVDVGMLSETFVGDYPRRPKEMTLNLDHDLRVTDLRIAFEETGAIPITWTSDHQLRQNRGSAGPNTRFADGLFEWEAKGERHKAVLEYENARYNRDRWPKVLMRLRSVHEDRQVFVVCRTPARVRSASAIIRGTKVFADRPVGLVIADFLSVTEMGLKSGFTDLEGHPFTKIDG